MNTMTLTAAASLGAVATATPVAALAAFDGVDDLAIADTAHNAVKEMAVCLSNADNAVAGYAKAYGQNRAVLQFARNFDAASLDASDKRAIGFDELPSTASAKRKLSQWHSRFRLIAERRVRPADAAADDGRYLTDAQLAGLYDGTVSFLTVYDNLVAADRKAKADKAKADKAKADAETVAATEAAPITMADMALALAAAWQGATDEERAAASEAMALLVETVNSTGGIIETADEQPEAVAA